MQKKTDPISLLLLALVLALPLPAHAFGESDGKEGTSLNLTSGYDINTVIAETGRILSIQTGDQRPNVQLELVSHGASLIICIGPQRYWAEKGLPFVVGDEITVRGSKAQGSDGIIYLMAQHITDTTKGISIVLRDESGKPAWAGKGMRRNQGQKP